jgi:hypothetical protein
VKPSSPKLHISIELLLFALAVAAVAYGTWALGHYLTP